MNLSSWRQNLFELWNRAPSGYRPGLTLGQLRRDLAGLDFTAQSQVQGGFHCPQNGLRFEVQERAQAQFLMHIVACEWRLPVPCDTARQARIRLRHTGAIRRQGVAARLLTGEDAEWAPLLQRLCSDQRLLEHLLPLDFKHLELRRDAQGWQVHLEHFGASEVVNRLPGFRRYIRLSAEQRVALLGSFTELYKLLRDF
ncbi:DUF3156 family protein [Pseudomonas protegens]|jgi:hypothetical protein|uniref:DUF3156 family protein n=2 Tax=Pseudomonas protegens TaxID=380021 RepID=Q4KBR3_PSEF5|nr:DUF3156 family protein [Pseudomonas protegens]AAY92484.1 conserved hypothetical protein [Pseudomonas protegens Pf-5]ASE23319.1 DUF3156 domain-containing protein [Pseudomonas protegens]PNV95668.1 DUF3156 domain-containing protein [Pseudomonas protegens]QEZ53011.1 DUF3156 family protein [Pseudomonas protegens]QEZ60789.1 DUF3156 family protein [Pseudomonas protegens]